VISTELRRHFLQQLLQERHPAHRRAPEELDKLMDDAERGSNATLSVDLESQTIKGPDGGTITFEIDPFPQALPDERSG
jgi:3-isopropylmalate/(R)-2-methylmalate dehydratase small subunit